MSDLVRAYRPGVEGPLLCTPERLAEEEDLCPWDERPDLDAEDAPDSPETPEGDEVPAPEDEVDETEYEAPEDGDDDFPWDELDDEDVEDEG